MTVIAMTREMGTLGKEVARRAAEMLGLAVVHHEMIETAADRDQAEPSEVARFLEASDARAMGDNGHHALHHGGYLTPVEIYGLALRGDVLIRGWGAARLLRGLPQVLTVRVCAPMERRIAEMRRRLGVDEARARQEIERSDAQHERAFLSFFAEDWRSPLNYDMTLNTAHLAIETCAELVRDAVTSPTLSETNDSRRTVEDRLLEARIAETLHGPGPLQRRAAHVDGAVDRGSVRLFGAVTDSTAAREIEDMVQGLPGVAEIRNEIARIGRYADG